MSTQGHLPLLTINRELSQLEFNYRVLQLAQDPETPLLERLKYLFITYSNLDEFFEIRVAGLKQHMMVDPTTPLNGNHITAPEVLTKISIRAHEILQELFAIYNNEIFPKLKKHHIFILKQHDWTPAHKKWITKYFEQEIMPVISPIALDVAHPFPRLVNKNLNFIVSLAGKDAFGRDSGMAIVHAPRTIPRLIPVPDELKKPGSASFFLLTSIIKSHVEDLFPSMKVKGCYQFRIIRNSDIFLDEHEIRDLPMAVKTSLSGRRFGHAVRLDVEIDCPTELSDYLLAQHQLTPDDIYHIDGQVNFNRLWALLGMIDHPELRFKPFTPALPDVLKKQPDLFAILRKGDVLLHHPYQSFEPVINLVRQAALDPNVVAIKQTLYRTNADSAIVTALVEAALAGKEVTAVIELRARFDEEQNIALATRLQEAGAIVVYGIVGYKTHAKMLLIVRRENEHLHRYVHLGTGNYHARTAREYTDVSLMTADADIGQDVQALFQELTGMGKATETKKLWHAPFTLFEHLKQMIQREIQHAKDGQPAYIMAKINALTDPTMVQLLYQASQAGVKIDLIVRSMCVLKPGVAGISENITVRSIVGRFLEHSRVYYFYNAGKEKIYCSSADFMERNLYHRLEVCFPIDDKVLAQRIKDECLILLLEDNCQSWELAAAGHYTQKTPKHKKRFAVQEFLLAKYTEK